MMKQFVDNDVTAVIVKGFEWRHENNPHLRGEYGHGLEMLNRATVWPYAEFVRQIVGSPNGQFLLHPLVVAYIYASIDSGDQPAEDAAREFWKRLVAIEEVPVSSADPAAALFGFFGAQNSRRFNDTEMSEAIHYCLRSNQEGWGLTLPTLLEAIRPHRTRH
jgi:hypothetical protein